MASTIKVFYSYSHADKQYIQNLEKHLATLRRNNIISSFYDGHISPGSALGKEILKELDRSNIVLFLVSKNFIASSACLDELNRTKENIEKNPRTRLVPLILEPCDWKDFESLGDYLGIPEDGKPISTWNNEDEAWLNAIDNLKSTIQEISSLFNPKQDFLDLLSEIEFSTHQESDVTIDDVFVFPTLIKDNERNQSPEKIDNHTELINEKKSIVVGALQSGKTKLLSHIFLKDSTKSKKTLFIDINDIRQKKPRIDILENAFNTQYEGDFQNWIKQENKTILVDNLVNSGKSLDHIKLFNKYFENIIITCSEDEYTSYFHDNDELIDFKIIKIRPLSHVNQEKIIKKWLQKSHQKDNIPHELIDKIEDHVNNIVINNKILPRYPFFILSILQAQQNFMPQNLQITSFGHCYNSLILARLIKSGVSQSDSELTACLNFCSHLAFEIYKSKEKHLNHNEFTNFLSAYKEQYLIKDTLVNKVISKYGIVNQKNNQYKFDLDYTYYYLLAKFLMDTNNDECKKYISKMINSTHAKENSLILIFTVHHTQDLEIIDEILTHTICAIEHNNPAKLDNEETNIFREITEALPKKLNTTENIDKHRKEERNYKESFEYQNSDDDFDENTPTTIGEIFKCIKNIEILSQILKNKSGSLEKFKIKEIIEVICDASLRLAKIMLIDEKELRKAAMYIYQQHMKSDSYDSKKPINSQINATKMLRFRCFLWVMGNIERAVNAINKPELEQIVQELSQERNTAAYEIINYFYYLDTSDRYSAKNKERLYHLWQKYSDKDHDGLFIKRILSLRTQYYFKTHKVKEQLKQSVNSLLNSE